LACITLAICLALPLGLGVALAAEQRSANDIVKALKPTITRGLTTSPADAARNAEETKFVNSLRNRATRSLTVDERDQITSIAKNRPSIDLEVSFDYNSDNIGSKAMPQVTALGEALSSSDLKGGTFILAGHTDAKGSETYNQGLSERRAEAVRRFLSQKYGIEVSKLVTVGYGKTHLKQAADPFGSENRRVQIINASDK
jgi:outer membrane protein OmpA-like peptidoglycan-associated protein